MNRKLFDLILIILASLAFGVGISHYLNPIDGWNVIRENSNQQYDIDNYNCLNFSQDLVAKLRIEGYESEIIIGDTPEGRHAWVSLWVEPITGTLVKKDSDYKKDFVLPPDTEIIR